MATQFPIPCDCCPRLMLFKWEVGRNQTYKCPVCTDRWATVWVNSSGGVNTVSYTNREGATSNHRAVAVGQTLGALASMLFGRK